MNTDAERAVGALSQSLDLKRRIVVERSAPHRRVSGKDQPHSQRKHELFEARHAGGWV